VTTPPDSARVRFSQRKGVTADVTGTTVVPWKPCVQATSFIVLANGATSAGTRPFSVRTRVVTPTLTGLKAPKTTTHTKGKAFRVTFSVQSSATGMVAARLKPGVKKKFKLAAGKNTFALKLPKSFKARKAVLTLQPSIAVWKGTPATSVLRFKRSK